MPRPRKRVLVSAFSFSPYHGSEPGIGWNIVSRLAAYHNVTALCHPWSRREYERYVEDHGPIPGLSICFVAPPRLSRWFQRAHVSLATPLYFVGYAAWQRAALGEAIRLRRRQPFEIVHHLTITGFREPGYLWKMGIPFVWGPVAGAADIPWSYLRAFGWRDCLFYGLKNLVNGIHKRTKYRSKRAARTAKHVFVVGKENQALVTGRWGVPSQIMLDTGSTPEMGKLRRFDGSRALRLVWSGLHVGRKAMPLLLYALAELGAELVHTRIRLSVLGSGRETLAWQALARGLGLESCIEWKGQLSRSEALAEMDQAHIFAFTSVQEGASTVVMEALSLGLPVICHDACGMGIAVDERCGIKVPMLGPRKSIHGFAASIQSFLDDPALVERLSKGALRRAEELSWDRKVDEIASVYDAVLNGSSSGASSGAANRPNP